MIVTPLMFAGKLGMFETRTNSTLRMWTLKELANEYSMNYLLLLERTCHGKVAWCVEEQIVVAREFDSLLQFFDYANEEGTHMVQTKIAESAAQYYHFGYVLFRFPEHSNVSSIHMEVFPRWTEIGDTWIDGSRVMKRFNSTDVTQSDKLGLPITNANSLVVAIATVLNCPTFRKVIEDFGSSIHEVPTEEGAYTLTRGEDMISVCNQDVYEWQKKAHIEAFSSGDAASLKQVERWTSNEVTLVQQAHLDGISFDEMSKLLADNGFTRYQQTSILTM